MHFSDDSDTNSYNYNCLTMALNPYILLSVLLPLLTLSQASSLNMNFTAPSVNVAMIINSQPQSQFILNNPFFDCSLPPIYTYQQTTASLASNAPTSLIVSSTLPTTINIGTKYNLLTPTISNTSCSPPSCTLTILNNCRQPIDYLNYFDIIQLSVSSGSFSSTLSYYIYCKDDYSPNTLEWGLIVEILLVTIAIAFVALYSKPWSLGGRGIEINYWLLGVYVVLFLMGAIVAAFSQTGITVCLYILSFVLGILCIGICANQLIFLLRYKPLLYPLFPIGTFQFRVQQLLSLLIGTGLTLGWYFSDNNIILNDIVSICICIGLIKILKFTSLLMAGLTFLITIVIELAVVIIIYIQLGQSYNNLFLNSYNFPVELQFPALNPTYNQKCAWLPVTAVIFPGMLLSYLRRFDTSRNTRVYLVTSTILFLLGGIAWVFVNIPSNVTFPFGLISEPCMFGLVCIFAYQRREIRVIWSGQFYDQQFANQKELRVIMEMIDRDRSVLDGEYDGSERRSTIDRKLIQELKASSGNGSSRVSDDNVVRSKFLRI